MTVEPGAVSVVIPCFEAASTIRHTLESVVHSSRHPLEVICVDDGSTDATAAAIEAAQKELGAPIRCAPAPDGHGGAAAARNFGASLARGEYLLFTDADVVFEPTALEAMVACLGLEETDAVVAQFQDTSIQPGALAHFQADTVSEIFQDMDAADAPCLGTQAALMKTAFFRGTTGFPVRYSGASVEDFAFGFRLRAEGARFRIARDARIFHNHEYDLRSFVRNYFVKARDLSELMMTSTDAAHGGYFSAGNLRSSLALGLAALAAASAPWLGWPALLVALVCVASMATMWAAHLHRLSRRFGPGRAAAFFVLRLVVLAAGAAGVMAGIRRAIATKISDRSESARGHQGGHRTEMAEAGKERHRRDVCS